MLIKSSAIDRLLRENPSLGKRRFVLPCIGTRNDREKFNPTVQNIADAINFYKKLGGKKAIEKDAKIGDKLYKEYGFYFELEKVLVR